MMQPPLTEPQRSWLPPEGTRLAAPAATMLRFPDLRAMLRPWRLTPIETSGLVVDGFVGWGRKTPARLASRLARGLRRPFWTLEDGFLRSVGLGKQGAPAMSLVIDDLGVYYDAATPSRLERILAEDDLTPHADRARALREDIARRRLTKYNHLPDRSPGLPRAGRRLVLVDQVAGDYSVPGALANAASFAAMLAAALNEVNAQIVLRMHPDVMAGKARGYFSALANRPGVILLDAPLSPHAVLDGADEIWTVSSQLGFDALLREIPVRCFGAPFYAGWGLTRDAPTTAEATNALARRQTANRNRSVDDLAAAALLLYPLYFDPVRGARVPAETVVERLAAGRAHAEVWRGRTFCPGLSWHKRKVLRAYCAPPGGEAIFARPRDAPDRVVVWGMCDERAYAPSGTQPVLRVEDGFIRSVGLGSDKIFPLSLCFDSRGMYYDASRPSDLETLLETAEFDEAELKRACLIRARLVAGRLSKYNLAAEKLETLPSERWQVVVFGQVPDDESLRLGAVTTGSNLAFLRRVREERPNAFIVFKEHPDLVSGGRAGATDLVAARQIADLVTTRGDAIGWIEAANEVHVRTSLAGFEALLRGKPVVCHGLPFYAGWGLTEDRVSTLRRRRRRSLDELVAAALIRYPTYLHPTRQFIMDAEDALAFIEATKYV